MSCEHKNFRADVNVGRLENDRGEPMQFNADVRVQCVDCGEPFRFLGLKSGLDLLGARSSVDGLEARLAIVPKSSSEPGSHTLRGYDIHGSGEPKG